jgi:modification methylase
MITTHTLLFQDSRDLSNIPDGSVQCVVTSPPYPMIGMWDAVFSSFTPTIAEALAAGDGRRAFTLIHEELDRVWRECFRVLGDGGFLCVNIGDATRSIGDTFRLFSNHSRITSFCTEIGFEALPVIYWWKPTNAPNKFMGSGMLPAGAYVTLEHEYILIFRKNGKRQFKLPAEKQRRNESAYFWEERNVWFSDRWELKGQRQGLKSAGQRDRSAAFPYELAFRLVNMYSIKGDTVLDPFAGTGTTTLAALAAGRSSIGVEIDPAFEKPTVKAVMSSGELLNAHLQERLARHMTFLSERAESGRSVKYFNRNLGMRVMTAQECEMKVEYVRTIRKTGPGTFEATYGEALPGVVE